MRSRSSAVTPIRHRRRADRAEIDRVESGERGHAVLGHHPLVLHEVFAAPRQLGEFQRTSPPAAVRRGLEHGDARRNDFLADAVAGDDCDAMCGHGADRLMLDWSSNALIGH